MKPSFRIAWVVFLLVLHTCAPEKPVLIIPPTPIGDGGRILRGLYRSEWVPPFSDEDLIRVGLVPSAPVIRFRTLTRTRIRAWSEKGSWEVASPEEVIWRVEANGHARPAITTAFALVETTVLPKGARPPVERERYWRAKGLVSARWVTNPIEDDQMSAAWIRWVLAVTPPTSARAAASRCGEIRKDLGISCQVTNRVELPPMGRGVLKAENGTFSKSFEGFLEIISPLGPTEVLDFVPEGLNGQTSREEYGPRLFIVSNLDASLALVQSVPLGSYLEGVVPSEIFPSAPTAALESQTIIARTYAVRYRATSGGTYPFWICASTDCQVYRGLKYKRPSTNAAVHETADRVLLDRDRILVDAYYHSICGGHTEPRKAIWGSSNLTYLGGASDRQVSGEDTPLTTDEAVRAYLDAPPTSFCGLATLTKPDRWRWNMTLGEAELEKLLIEVGLKPPLLDLRVIRRGVSGRALEVEIKSASGSKRVSGELTIRKLFGGLLSSLLVFDVIRDGRDIQSVTIRGAGYGHGVGLCQMGAIGRAEQGQSVEQILSAYYPTTRLGLISEAVLK